MPGWWPRSSVFPQAVWALDAALPKASRTGRLATRGALLGLASGLGLWTVLAAVGWLEPRALGLGAVVGGHSALLGASLGPAIAVTTPARRPTVTILITTGLLALGVTGATLGPGGAFAYLALPLWLALLAGRGRLSTVGVRRPERGIAILVGLSLGTALGGHLLLSATQSLGYRVRQDGLGAYLATLAYDVGANVPSSELFFRGVLFDHLQRRWSFVTGASVATAAYLVRYLLDPRLPGTTEAMIGGVVYLSLLSLGNCWVFWWSGSLIPALVSALAFFASYRMLTAG
jgi:Type II CAAX prenyl endopeptidase Rce1-like